MVCAGIIIETYLHTLDKTNWGGRSCMLMSMPSSVQLSLLLVSYIQLKADHSAYYRDALRYLGCVNLSQIPCK